MKTIRPLLLLASTGVLLAAAAPARGQGALRVDQSGHPTSPLNLGDAHVVGTLDPARLGSGSPSSATVLRGDGSWVGTTPAGNTVASTGSLLMGDGAGNAVAVPDGANLLTVLRLRLDTRQANAAPVANLLAGQPPSVGTLNADGTVTVPANGFVAWYYLPNSFGGQTLYGVAVATAETPPGALALHLNYGADWTGTDATPAPGVATSATVVHSDVSSFNVFVRNATATPLTIYYPVVSPVDAGLALTRSYADFAPVAAPPVADLDFTRFAGGSEDRSGRYALEKQTTLAVDGVNGLDANAGTLYAPKLTLAQPVGNGSVLGVYRGSAYRASLPLAGQNTARGLEVRDLAFGSQKALPIVSGLDPVPPANLLDLGSGVYGYLWTPTEPLVNDGYSNVYVVEINQQSEAAAPIASRRRLVDGSVLASVNSPNAVAALPGSALILPPGTGAGQSGSTTQWKVIFHPSDGNTPQTGGTYRYEVVSRVAPAPWYTGNGTGDGALGGVQLVGGNSGYGPLSGPTGFVGDRLVVLHNTTHSAVLGGGSLQRSVFYELGDRQSIMLAWYANDPTGLSWDLRQCLFYAVSPGGVTPPNFLIAHSGVSGAFTRGDVRDCAFLGGRLANGSLGGVLFSPNNVNRTLLDRCYAYGVGDLLGQAFYAGSEIRRSVLRQVARAYMPASFHDNLLAGEPFSDPGDPGRRGVVGCVIANGATTVNNNLFWLRNPGASGVANDDGATFLACQGGLTPSVTHNIVVLDATGNNALNVYANLGTTSTLPTLDYNLVIQTGGAFANYGPGAGGGNPSSWAQYVAAQPTLDPHSKYVDLRGDPRGLRAVFVDPAGGDFRWAQTAVARDCAAYCRANHVGPATVTSCWPTVPTVDEAARALTDL